MRNWEDERDKVRLRMHVLATFIATGSAGEGVLKEMDDIIFDVQSLQRGSSDALEIADILEKLRHIRRAAFAMVYKLNEADLKAMQMAIEELVVLPAIGVHSAARLVEYLVKHPAQATLIGNALIALDPKSEEPI